MPLEKMTQGCHLFVRDSLLCLWDENTSQVGAVKPIGGHGFLPLGNIAK